MWATGQTRTCFFCGEHVSPRAKTMEHVIGRGVLKRLGIQYEPLQAYQGWLDGEHTDHPKRVFDSLHLGGVCDPCNHDWSGTIECRANPLLGGLMNHRLSLDTLTPDQAPLLARWAAKAAYLINATMNSHRKIPVEHVRSLRFTDELPEGVAVLGGQPWERNPEPTGSRRFYWLEVPTWASFPPFTEEQMRFAAEESYKITMLLGPLVLTVAYWPTPEWRITGAPGMHKMIWPREMLLQAEPEAMRPSSDMVEAARAFHESVSLIAYDVLEPHVRVALGR